MKKTPVWIKATLIVLAALLCGATVGAVFATIRDLPEIKALESFAPSTATRVYSADKELLAELYVKKRIPVALKQIPDHLEHALLATEDRQFYEHSGLDLKGIIRAVIHDIRAGGFEQGASTITQQLAKTLFLTPEKSLERKLKEAFLAFQLERRYTKNEILELYLNQVYFGSGAYGVAMAARTYFAKPVENLNIAECALIAGLPKAPSAYSPLVNPELAVRRRNIVLRQMRDVGYISPEAYNIAKDTPYAAPDSSGNGRKAPYFIDFIKRRLEDVIGSDMLYKGGVTVLTTLSHDMQTAAQRAVETGLTDLSQRMQKNGITEVSPQSALVAIDVTTGGILAMIGGKDYFKSPYNRATMARRQPGSAFKPIIYAYAAEKGFDQDTLLLDAPVAFNGAVPGEDWQPENFSKTYQGEMTIRKALTHSKNIPAVRMLQRLGPNAVIEFARDLGIDSPLAPYLSMALGSFEVTLLELTGAYAVFPNKGQFIEPYGVIEVIGRDGRLIWRAKPSKRVVMSRTGAAIVTDMLKGVIDEGTGRTAKDIGRPIAGKTGTTNQYRDALFMGFSPTIAAGVWVGCDDYTPLGPYETGARAALPIWKTFMQSALADAPLRYFDFPDELMQIRMDPLTGKRISGKGGVKARIRKSQGDRHSN